MAYELPPLPYGFDALEPHIDAKTMEIHHDKHHQAYVNNANGALEKHPELAKKSVEDYPNQDSPYMEGMTPILGVDVWEHAYYLKYQNKRPDYVAAWFNTINWKAVAERYK